MVMGLLVDGVWQQDSAGKEFGSRTEGGHFIRRPTVFHNYVTADGSPGPTGIGGFAAERGRYHLYVSLACPWAHRTLIFRKLKKLDDVISVSDYEAAQRYDRRRARRPRGADDHNTRYARARACR
jgi:glutathionyl-hydroquinone reductase